MPFPRVRLLSGSLSPSKFGDKISSFSDPGCLSRILDPGSEFFPSQIPDPGSKFFASWIPDPGSEFFPSRILDPWCALKNLSILTKKMVSQLSEIWSEFSIPDPDPGSGSWLFTYPRCRSWIQIPNPGIKKAPDPWPGSRIRICNIGDFGFAQAVGGSVGYWLSTGAAVFTTDSMDQLSEVFMCKKEFSVYFIFTLSL